MFLGKVIGTVWSTKKAPDLEGVRFLVVHPYDLDHEPTKNVVVVADRLGAGTGETVILRLYGEIVDHAQSVVLPLLLPDAPVVVWWPVH